MPTQEWLDLVLLDGEADLVAQLGEIRDQERRALRRNLQDVLGISDEAIEDGILRMLIERARPLALPNAVWRRSLDATWSVREAGMEHLKRLGFDPSNSRLRAMQELYTRFATERGKVPVSTAMLGTQNYACAVCGLRFYNDELSELGFVSPLGDRPRAKEDSLKPHWSTAEFRRPTVEHLWPVSLYGSNARKNLAVTCRGCNIGRANYMSLHQMKPFVGLPLRRDLRSLSVVHPETFFAQMQREPVCQESGRTWREIELTIRLRNRNYPPVLDNLVTIGTDDV